MVPLSHVLTFAAIRHRTWVAEALAARVLPVAPLRAIRDGFAVGAANLKTIVFFVVGLPEFVSVAVTGRKD
jgi:threonine/homoserine/homoserine lactone efflux protein